MEHGMKYLLSETDVNVIKSALNAHLKQCEEFLKLDDKVKTFTVLERTNLEEKINHIKDLLKNM